MVTGVIQYFHMNATENILVRRPHKRPRSGALVFKSWTLQVLGFDSFKQARQKSGEHTALIVWPKHSNWRIFKSCRANPETLWKLPQLYSKIKPPQCLPARQSYHFGTTSSQPAISCLTFAGPLLTLVLSEEQTIFGSTTPTPFTIRFQAKGCSRSRAIQVSSDYFQPPSSLSG